MTGDNQVTRRLPIQYCIFRAVAEPLNFETVFALCGKNISDNNKK